jgi:hypothetical protein
MRLLHLYWPHLLIRLAQARSSGPFEAEPIVLGGMPWTNGSVLDASRLALELGVRPGLALGAAHRLAPEARFLDPNREADGAAMEAALDRMSSFSPSVAVEMDPTRPGFGRADVQLDGLERLWGPEPLIANRLGRALSEVLPGSPLAGIGGTRFAAAVAASLAGRGVAGVAWDRVTDRVASGARAEAATRAAWSAGGAASGSAARAASGSAASGSAASGVIGGAEDKAAGVRLHVVEPGADAEFLAPLPAAMLSRDPEVRARLDRFGLRRIGQVAELPLSSVVARFGPQGERIHARARALETEPFRPRRAPERMALALPIEPAVADVESLRFVLHRLAAAFGEQLVARGAAAGRARLTLELDGTFAAGRTPPSLVIDQRLPEPTSEGLAVERLLLARIEASPPPAPVSRLELELGDVAPAAGTQLALFTPQTGRTGRLGWQLARIGLRFGEHRIGWMEIGDPEAPLAEARWSWRRPVGSDVDDAPDREPRR